MWWKLLLFVRNVRMPQAALLIAAFIVGLWIPGDFARLFAMLHMWITWESMVIIWLLWSASVAINDAHDLAIDRITNRHRPLVRGVFSRRAFRVYGYVATGCALLFAALTLPAYSAASLAAFAAINAAYNAPPLRLKRYLTGNVFLPPAAVFAIVIAGYTLAQPHAPYPYSIPLTLLALVALAITITIKDFKDIAGDRAEGIRTLPVVVGIRHARIATATAASVLVFSISAMHAWLTHHILGTTFLALTTAAAVFLSTHIPRYAIAVLLIPSVIGSALFILYTLRP